MFKAIRRLLGLFAFLAIIFGVVKSVFDWAAQNSNDNHEVFVDEDDHQGV